MLAMACAESLLARIERSASEMERARGLLGDTLAELRINFSSALAADAGPAGRDACHRSLEAAMIALQSEDSLLQMMGSMQTRTQQMADAVRHAALCIGDGLTGATAQVPAEPLANALRKAIVLLDTGMALDGPVAQEKAAAGPVELF
jgi:hypothetical protein